MKDVTEHVVLEERAADKTVLFGFWLYLMTDFVLFASLFAVYAVLHNNTFGSPGSHDIFSAPFVLLETLILLASSFVCGLALIAAHEGNRKGVIALLGATAALGALFVGLEVNEFAHLEAAGSGWWQSGFLSSYFTLVGTHGLHVSVGILWMLVLIGMIAKRGLSRGNMRKLAMLAIFWHFLDLVWIFIFTIVYMMGLL